MTLLRNLLCIFGVLMAGCAEGPPPTSGGSGATPAVPAAKGPVAPTANADLREALHDANLVVRLDGDRMTVIGSGDSMQPVFGEGTVLVLKKIPFDDLRDGMTVAYINHAGVKVVHKLYSKESGGWRVMGLNNDFIDGDLVTGANLIGVVYATFYSDADKP